MGEPQTVRYSKAEEIRAVERDRALRVDRADWAETPPSGWDSNGQFLSRLIHDDRADEEERTSVPVPVEELVLRFPSAPIHGLQRLHMQHFKVRPSENFHTFRVLRSGTPKDLEQPVSRI